MAHVEPFPADSPGAIVLPAATYGYDGKPGIYNDAVAIGLHTPEESPDATASTPAYFHNLFGRNASTHYFLAYALQNGITRVMQMVPEESGAYGNAVQGKPYPAWADPNINLNLQTISIEIEGFAASIHQTMPRGGDQWNALVWLLADIARRNPAVNLDWTFGHYLVSNQRSDPGQLDIPALVADAKALLNEEDEMLDTDDRLYLAGLMRGVIRALATGLRFNTPLRQGDDDYTNAENSLNALADKLDTMPTLALSDDDLKRLAKYVNDDAAERMKE